MHTHGPNAESLANSFYVSVKRSREEMDGGGGGDPWRQCTAISYGWGLESGILKITGFSTIIFAQTTRFGRLMVRKIAVFSD